MSKIVVAGGSGMIGGALMKVWRDEGDEVRQLVRREARHADEVTWNPAEGRLDAAALEGVDAVVNLAGANIGEGRWTARRRAAIRSSRLDATRTLADGLCRTKRRPRVLVCASATGIYGDRGEEWLDESASPGRGFLADVCLAWERETQPAVEAGVRVVGMRFGAVLHPGAGVLGRLVPLFRCGLGGRLGSGRQWMSWITLEDAIAAVRWAVENDSVKGACNAVAPEPARNAEFAAALGGALHRPTWLPTPAWVLRLGLGEMADELLLSSTRAVPARLQETGFRFRHPRINEACRALLSR